MIEQYSIWLVPCEEDEVYLSEIIRDLSLEYDAPLFQPHCTLYSPVVSFEKAEHLLESLDLQPIEVKKTGIGQSDVIWKTVFIELEMSEALVSLNQQCATVFSSPYFFHPHISLIYKEMPKEEKASIIRKLEVKVSYVMDKISIVKTGEDVNKWQCAYSRGVNPKC